MSTTAVPRRRYGAQSLVATPSDISGSLSSKAFLGKATRWRMNQSWSTFEVGFLWFSIGLAFGVHLMILLFWLENRKRQS